MYSSKLNVVTFLKETFPSLFAFIKFEYTNKGDVPVAKPKTESGFVFICFINSSAINFEISSFIQ